MSQIPHSQPRSRGNLPVWDTVCASFRSVFIENLNHLPNAVVGSLVLSLVIGLFLFMFLGRFVARGLGIAASDALLFVVLLFAAFAPYVMFAVAWHRLILLGPAVAPTVIPTWRERHWRFYGYSLLIVLLSAVLMMVIMGMPLLVIYYAIESQLLQGLTAVIGFIVASTIILRLCLVFPATAVDERYGLGDAMRQSERQGLRFFASMFLISLPFLVADGIVRLLLVNASPDALNTDAGVLMVVLVGMIWLALHTIISYLQSAVIISFLSLSFWHLSGWRPKEGNSAAPQPAGDAGFGAT